MALINTFLLKGGMGFMTALLGVTGFYFSNSYLNNRMTRYDAGLINFLNSNGKIKFKVQKDNKDLTSFPTFDNNEPISIRVSVSTSDNGALVDATGSNVPEKGKKDSLKKLNGKSAED